MLTNNKGERIHFLLTEQGFVLGSSEDETFLQLSELGTALQACGGRTLWHCSEMKAIFGL